MNAIGQAVSPVSPCATPADRTVRHPTSTVARVPAVDREERLDRDAYDALVIGSGFGGAVAACRLAHAGVDVAVVERGRRFAPGEFPRDLSRLDDGWLWACDHALYDAAPLNDTSPSAPRAPSFTPTCSCQRRGAGARRGLRRRVAAAYTRQALDPYYDLARPQLTGSDALRDS